MYKLFYYPRNASWAPHLILAELGVKYELILVDRKTNAQKSAEYLQLNPSGRIPTLIDDGLTIFESAAIGLHLCDKHPKAKLIPAIGDPLRPLCLQWLFYLNASLQPELMVYFYPAKHTTATHVTSSLKAAQELRVTEMFMLIDKALEGQDFLVGDRISICDYFLFMLAHWASGFTRSPQSFTNLGRYLRKLAQRPAVRSVCATEGTSLDLYL